MRKHKQTLSCSQSVKCSVMRICLYSLFEIHFKWNSTGILSFEAQFKIYHSGKKCLKNP